MPTGHSDRVRLVEVAEAARVTKGTASRVLNGDPTVAVREETRARILEVARQLGYEPHAGARALARSRTMTLAFLAPALDNPPYVTIARGAYRRAAEHGYLSLLAEDFGDQPAGRSLIDGGRVDGVLMGSAYPEHPLVDYLAERGFPHVFLNRSISGSGRNVTMDVGRASALAVSYLASLGHTRIAHLAGPVAIEPSELRRQAFEEAIAAAGLQALPPVHSDFLETAGYLAGPALVEREPTAIFTSSLGQAIGVMRYLTNAGIEVPRQMSVVAYDDFPLAEFTVPALTTIAMPLFELGAAAVDELVAQLGGAQPRDVVIETEPRLVVRGSTDRPSRS